MLWIQSGLAVHTIVWSMSEAVALTLYLRALWSPESTSMLDSSPSAITREAWKRVVGSPPPHDATSAAATTATPPSARRRSHRGCLIQGLQGKGSGRRGAVEPIAHPVPLGTRRRLFDPDQMHTLAIESTKDREQFVRRLLRPRRHAPMDDAGGDARRNRARIYRQPQRVAAEDVERGLQHRRRHDAHLG